MKKVLSILLTLILVLSVSFDCQAADISWSNDYVATANSSGSVVVPLTAYYTFYLQGGDGSGCTGRTITWTEKLEHGTRISYSIGANGNTGKLSQCTVAGTTYKAGGGYATRPTWATSPKTITECTVNWPAGELGDDGWVSFHTCPPQPSIGYTKGQESDCWKANLHRHTSTGEQSNSDACHTKSETRTRYNSHSWKQWAGHANSSSGGRDPCWECVKCGTDKCGASEHCGPGTTYTVYLFNCPKGAGYVDSWAHQGPSSGSEISHLDATCGNVNGTVCASKGSRFRIEMNPMNNLHYLNVQVRLPYYLNSEVKCLHVDKVLVYFRR